MRQEITEAKNAYYEAWAKMMITIWQDKIIGLGIRDSGDLLTSFVRDLHIQSGGDIGKITHTYLAYGRMVDMGVGRGSPLGDSGRKQKNWYSKAYYHSVKVLSEKMAQLYGEEFQYIITGTLNG
jgi:hypothetical protein